MLDRLNADREKALESYFRLREKLVRFFGWRGHPQPEDLADVALDRAAIKIQTGADVQPAAVPAFVLGIARFIYLEEMRRLEAEKTALRQFREQTPSSSRQDSENPLLTLLLRCLDQIPSLHRKLILRYYEGDGEERIRVRQEMAQELGLDRNTLRIRTHRIRRSLEACTKKLLAQSKSRSGRRPPKLVAM